MSITGLSLNDMLEAKMAYDAERQKVIAQNVANIDTPGYRAQDLVPLDFRNVLKSQTSRVALAVTSDMHMNGAKPHTMRFRSETSQDALERTPTGGTVVLEDQMMKVSQNAMDYQMTTSLYKKISNLFMEAMSLQPTA
jgi:flagellar basal-body rod protein FlgB